MSPLIQVYSAEDPATSGADPPISPLPSAIYNCTDMPSETLFISPANPHHPADGQSAEPVVPNATAPEFTGASAQWMQQLRQLVAHKPLTKGPPPALAVGDDDQFTAPNSHDSFLFVTCRSAGGRSEPASPDSRSSVRNSEFSPDMVTLRTPPSQNQWGGKAVAAAIEAATNAAPPAAIVQVAPAVPRPSLTIDAVSKAEPTDDNGGSDDDWDVMIEGDPAIVASVPPSIAPGAEEPQWTMAATRSFTTEMAAPVHVTGEPQWAYESASGEPSHQSFASAGLDSATDLRTALSGKRPVATSFKATVTEPEFRVPPIVQRQIRPRFPDLQAAMQDPPATGHASMDNPSAAFRSMDSLHGDVIGTEPAPVSRPHSASYSVNPNPNGKSVWPTSIDATSNGLNKAHIRLEQVCDKHSCTGTSFLRFRSLLNIHRPNHPCTQLCLFTIVY